VSGRLFPTGAFAGFGSHRLYPWSEAVAVHRVQARPKMSLRALVRQQCPHHPGVYGMIDGEGELTYVGKAKSLRARLLGYFRPRGRDRRVRHILSAARALTWEFAPSEFAALLRELELIRQWRPRCNIQGQPRLYRRAFVCLGKRPAPYIYLARRPPAGAVGCFGPVFPGPRLREAIRRLNDSFRLRDCPQPQEMIFANESELFPVIRAAGCIRHEIGTCLGPCAAACTEPAYEEAVCAARAFLDGSDRSLLDKLQRDEQAAAGALDFERAAALRDQRTSLDWLVRHLERVRQAQDKHTFVYPVAGHGGRDLWYLIRRGWVVAALPTPRLPEEHRAAALQIEKTFAAAEPWNQAAGVDQIDTVLLVDAWFRKRPEERKRCITPAKALEQCRQASRRRA